MRHEAVKKAQWARHVGPFTQCLVWYLASNSTNVISAKHGEFLIAVAGECDRHGRGCHALYVANGLLGSSLPACHRPSPARALWPSWLGHSGGMGEGLSVRNPSGKHRGTDPGGLSTLHWTTQWMASFQKLWGCAIQHGCHEPHAAV